MYKLLCRTISSTWNILVFWRKYENLHGKEHVFQRKIITNRPIAPGDGVRPVLQANPLYGINASSGKYYTLFNHQVSAKDNILNQLYVHLTPRCAYSVKKQIVVHKEMRNQRKIGVYTFTLEIKYFINDPVEFVRQFYHYIGTSLRNDSSNIEEELYTANYFETTFLEMITPLLQQSCNKLICNNSNPNQMTGIDFVQLWERINPDNKTESNMHNFALIQINKEYEKVPSYISIGACVVKRINYREI